MNPIEKARRDRNERLGPDFWIFVLGMLALIVYKGL